MSDEILALMGKFLVGILIFIRISGFMYSAPFFKQSAIPIQVKIFFSIILAVMINSVYWHEQPTIDLDLWNLVLVVFKELMVGIILGFTANLVFFAARFAGGIIDIEMGYQTSMLFDVQQATPTLVGNLKEFAVLIVFLYLNGHHQIIETLYASLRVIPLMEFAMSESTIDLIVRLAVSVLVLGVKMSAPVLVALFATNLALALLARIAPQTNIFILSFQLKVFVGLIILFFSVPLFIYVAKVGLESVQTQTMEIIMTLNPARVN